jgi:DNA-binding SARP family transcriptional activator
VTAGGEIGPKPSASHLATCRLAGAWLESRQYEQAATVLHSAQTDGLQAGDALLAHILDAAQRLCRACKQCQEETEWHRQAYRESEHREQELRQELYAILQLIDTGQAPETPLKLGSVQDIPGSESGLLESRRPKAAQRLSLWQRIQALLGHRPPDQLPRPEPIKAPPEAQIQPVRADLEQNLPATPDLVTQGTGLEQDLPTTLDLVAQGADLEQDRPTTPDLAVQGRSSAKAPGEEAAPALVVYCLGAFRVYQGDRLITDWNGLKGKSILKYLLAHRETSVAKDILMDLFWPDADPESARRSLHQAIYSLRQALRRGNPDFAHVYFENDCYLLNPGMSIWVDSVEFERHLETAKRLEAADRITEAIAEYGIAESLYQGDYLEEDLYEDWPAVEREHFRRMYCDLADRLSEHYVHNSEYNAAITLCHKILGCDNCHEPAHRRLMRCYLAQGQRHLAVRQYQTCVETLQIELEIGPAEETVMLYQEITDAQ